MNVPNIKLINKPFVLAQTIKILPVSSGSWFCGWADAAWAEGFTFLGLHSIFKLIARRAGIYASLLYINIV